MAVRARLVSEDLSDASFMLVEMKGPDATPVYDHAGQLMKFKTGGEADAAARSLSDDLGVKIQPRRINDKNWKIREATRMKDGTYQPLPWADQKWWGELANIHSDHYPHVSIQKTALIAFTEDDTKGSADVQTPLKPGRYLERFFGGQLNNYVIRDLSAIFSSKYEDNKLQFAETPDDLEEIFTEGPSSCMSKAASEYKTNGVHPVRMYAAGDLQLAYLRRQGRVVARAIVWPEKKIYNTPYGDGARIKDLLHKAGFKSGTPFGARLTRLKYKVDKTRYTFITPHVDNSSMVIDDGEHLIVADPNKSKDKAAGLTTPGGTGHTEVLGYVCIHCSKDSFAQRQIVAVYAETPDPVALCQACAKEQTVTCSHTGSQIYKAHAVQVGRHWLWQRVLHDAAFRCAGSGELHLLEDMVRMPDGRMWSRQYAAKHTRACHCGASVPRDTECAGSAGCLFRKKELMLTASLTYVKAMLAEGRR